MLKEIQALAKITSKTLKVELDKEDMYTLNKEIKEAAVNKPLPIIPEDEKCIVHIKTTGSETGPTTTLTVKRSKKLKK